MQQGNAGMGQMGGQHGGDDGKKRGSKFVPGKVFLGGLAHQTSQDTLRDYAANYGEVADVHIMAGKGYAFITFASPASAQAFLDYRNHEIDGRHVDAKAAVPREQGASRLTKKLFVGGVDNTVTDEDFRTYFAQFGTTEGGSVMRRPDGSSRGYGFILFEDEISVEKCLVQEHTLGDRTVDCKRALGKEQQQQQQGQQGGAMVGGMAGQAMGSGYGAMQGGQMGGMNPNAAAMGMYGMPMNPMMNPMMGGWQTQMPGGMQMQPQMGMQVPGMETAQGGMTGYDMMGAGGMGMYGMQMNPMMMAQMGGAAAGAMPNMGYAQGTGGAMGGGMGGAAQVAAGGQRGGGNGPKQPDWNCATCGATNYGYRHTCHKCKTRNGAGAGAGGIGGGLGAGMGGGGGRSGGRGTNGQSRFRPY